MVNSWYAKLLSIRKVSQENKGKKTAGIDGIKSLSPTKRLKLAKILTIDGTSQPTRRVWIPKPGRKEMRPLGIPTMEDRAKQALVKLASLTRMGSQILPSTHMDFDQEGLVMMP